MDKARIGVFICRCGGNISDRIDIGMLKDSLKNDDKSIVFIHDDEHLCSANGQEKIRESIKGHGLERIVIGACSPSVHENTFMRCAERAGLNPYLVEIANIREQCSWSSRNPENAERKALLLLSSAAARVGFAQPLEKIRVETKKSAVVIGGGVAGITAALSLAKQGIRTHIVEKRESIGGNMVRVGKVFSPDKLAEECALCALSPMMNDIASCPSISLLTLAEVDEVRGCAGNFHVVAKKKPSFVDASKCTGCGQCSEECPVEVGDWWNAGLKKRKAIFRPFPQAVPNTYTIDSENCIRCGNCVPACRQGAIDLNMKEETAVIDAGAIVIATGHSEYDARKKEEYGYGRFKDVITQTEFSRLSAVNGPTLGKLLRPSDNTPPRRVVMIQCVGSRDEKPGGNKYCSKVCCMVAIKHAAHIKIFSPDTDVIVCYMDIRAFGRYENYFRHAQESGVRFVRGKPSEVIEAGGILVVRLEDTLSKELIELEADLVVLSEGMGPSAGTTETAGRLNVSLGEDTFIKEKHSKLNPVATDAEGIFACGTALGPKDITDSVVQAGAAAAKASELLNWEIEIEPKFIEIDAKLCDNCGKCVSICRYKAIYCKETSNNGKHSTSNEKNNNGKIIAVDPLACAGCGGCVPECKTGAISQKTCSDGQLHGAVTALLSGKKPGEKRIIAFLDSKVAYIAADNAGANRLNCGDDVYIVRVPSTNRIGINHVLHAFKEGADGIFLGEGPENGPMGRMFGNVQERFNIMRMQLAKEGIDPKRLFFAKVYAPHFRGLIEKIDLFKKDLGIAA